MNGEWYIAPRITDFYYHKNPKLCVFKPHQLFRVLTVLHRARREEPDNGLRIVEI